MADAPTDLPTLYGITKQQADSLLAMLAFLGVYPTRSAILAMLKSPTSAASPDASAPAPPEQLPRPGPSCE